MNKPKYMIYPSLLDRFQKVVDVEKDFEDFMNDDDEAGYKVSLEEMTAQREQDLLDAINRVPHDPIEKADKGTCFNEIVDRLILNAKTGREDVTIKSRKAGATYYTSSGNQSYIEMPKDCDRESFEAWAKLFGAKPVGGHIEAKMNDFTFRFDLGLCLGAKIYFDKAIPQHRCEATIDTTYGSVLLYGYADEIRRDIVYDIKTTSIYGFGKFEHAWQKHLYPYCLVKSGESVSISEFEYTVYKLSGGTPTNPIITADMYRERYDFDFSESERKLRQVCERFIEWLEAHKDKITDKKIFGYDQ